jgi:hypothetical protein
VQLDSLAAGSRADPKTVSTLDELISAGLQACDDIIGDDKTAPSLLASAA